MSSLLVGSGRGRTFRCALISLVLLLGPGCTSREGPPGQALLEEVGQVWGFPRGEAEWPAGRYRIPEITSAGLALLDVEGDGDLDVYQVCHPPPDAPGGPAPNRLFRNVAPGRFEEVPGALGLADPGHGNGAATGDADGDGFVDVYVCNLGPDSLLLNQRGERFTDATRDAGIVETTWSTGAAFFDPDADGDLDLYVVHYLVDDPTKICRVGRSERQDYCGPARFQSVPDQLFINLGGGRFEDRSRAAGITRPRAGLAVTCLDLTGDGKIDVYVANDREPNNLFVNLGNGTFRDEGLERGVALGGNGDPEASMGIGAGDLNGDGLVDLAVTCLFEETLSVYFSVRPGAFEDRSAAAGVGAATFRYTSWGVALVDLDADGDLDLPVVNGKIERSVTDPRANVGAFWNEYSESNQLFLNDGKGHFTEPTGLAGAFGSSPEPGRALAVGDLDGDGAPDLVTSDVRNHLRVFRNRARAPGTHWLRVRAMTRGRDALGAVVRVEAAGVTRERAVATSSSYASASDPAVHFGLGQAATVTRLEVRWPSGKVQGVAPPPVDRTVTVVEEP